LHIKLSLSSFVY